MLERIFSTITQTKNTKEITRSNFTAKRMPIEKKCLSSNYQNTKKYIYIKLLIFLSHFRLYQGPAEQIGLKKVERKVSYLIRILLDKGNGNLLGPGLIYKYFNLKKKS